MRKNVWFGLAGLVSILLGATLWQNLTRPDPVYRGKRLSLWLKEVPQPDAFQHGFNDLVQEQGSVVVPHLIRALRTTDNFWRPYVWARRNAPGFVVRRLPQWVEPQLVREAAANWLAAMGPSAKIAAPYLRQAADRDRSQNVRVAAIYGLVRVGQDPETTALLIHLLQNPSASVRQAAAGGLEIWTPAEPDIVPLLIERLRDSDAVVRQVCTATLGKYGKRAATAVPVLQKLAASDDQAADYARSALEQIQAEVETKSSSLP